MGFVPGFPYLGGMSEKIATPRLKDPRPRIPAGSVGIADPRPVCIPWRNSRGMANYWKNANPVVRSGPKSAGSIAGRGFGSISTDSCGRISGDGDEGE